ncbi:hypothetical protein OFR22_14140 [Brachyspira hyodysenteriae]|uniref:hypothetical protein n=1 Tax=Brachyspira hyodysenteriae TaxID=159 RepID=UPI0022CD2A5E|nr:hypothetical protein [Brachyspira hyodysenteriae]MCZ9838909.1 hypothetical protein [Brachyspira hyodysenteriae]MCZ9848197.1 hypothetical protein [Brachyspira hyodysenteriae]MCZ9851755.1 hypothetical protein [Brachyspira hyodysenteriae]MCZ9859507.1 hypothetical protein [Brachyspira hyodysenteriae]MCZ9870111.1 hypothetical protein [Brachyspira hyodysenteriae]
MLRFLLIFIILFSFNIYSQNIDEKPIKVNEKYFTENGNLKDNRKLSTYAIRKIRFTDKSSYEMIILKNNYWYYYTLFQIEQNNKYKYIGNIALKSFNQTEGLIGNIVYKDNFFTVEHTVMSNLKMYITFKYNDDKKIYLDKTSMIVELVNNTSQSNTNTTTSKQVNGNVVPNKILYKDVTMDMISKLLSLDL